MVIARWLLIVTLAGLIGNGDTASAQEEAAPSPAPAAVSRRSDAAAPATRPSRVPAARRQNARKAGAIPPSVTTSLQEIAKEFQQGEMRDKSDYLSQKPNAELTPELVVQLLGRPLGDSAGMDGYIKWQLISALTQELPVELMGAALGAYRNAPGLQRRPGIDPGERRTLDLALRRGADATSVAAELDQEVRRVDLLNSGVKGYRDVLFARLPSELATFQAALNDAYERCNAGVAPQSLTDRLSARAMQWINTAASDAEVRQLAAMVRKLMAIQVPDFYDGVRENDQGPGYVWIVRRADPNSGGMLADILRSADRKLMAGAGSGADEPGSTGRGRGTGRRGR